MAIAAETLDGWLAALEQLHPKPIELGLTRVYSVAQQMGLLQLPCPLITVAGTNGKGSTVSYLDAVYRAAGYRVCCQFSPHMLRFNERIRLHGQDASDAQILEAFSAIEVGREDVSLTYFEYTVLAAVWLYLRAKPDVIILEVGLGGRLDACNIWDCDAAIITNISVDHQRWLGDSREAIGGEKAAVARKNKPAIVGDINPPASLLNTLGEIGADVRLITREFSIVPSAKHWTYKSDTEDLELPRPTLAGEWQLTNAACAVSAVRALEHSLPVKKQALAQGLQEAHIAGRFQSGRVDGVAVVMDVGHNPDAARQLATQLKASQTSGRVLAVSAVMADKDLGGMLACLDGCFDGWYLGGLAIERAMSPHDYRTQLEKHTQVPSQCFDTLDQAFDSAIAAAEDSDRVVVFGSFYTVAELIARFG